MSERKSLPLLTVQGPARHLQMDEVVEGRKPPWLKVRFKSGPNFQDLRRIAREGSLHTICEEAMCPNISECWEEREATFLIGGDRCTRRCGFCDVMTAKPDAVDEEEPAKIADAVR